MNEREIKELENTIAVNKDYKKHYHLCDYFEVELIDKLLKQFKQIQQENQQLKEQLKDEENWRVKIAKENSSNVSECLKLIEQKKQYKSVLDEIREFIKKCSFSIEGITNEYHDIVYAEDIEEILDKVKE